MFRSTFARHSFFAGISVLLVVASPARAQVQRSSIPRRTLAAAQATEKTQSITVPRPIDEETSAPAAEHDPFGNIETAPKPDTTKAIVARTTSEPGFGLPLELVIEGILDAPATIEANETPLDVVLAEISRAHDNVTIVLDRRALEDAAIQPDAPISAHFVGIPLRTSLESILDPLGLTYVVDKHLLKITTKEAAGAKIFVRVYHLGELGKLVQNDEQLNQLSELLQSTALKETAEATGGESSVQKFRHLLIIRAPYHGQRAVRELLADLRQGMGQGSADWQGQ
jgi:hypothetical protein